MRRRSLASRPRKEQKRIATGVNLAVIHIFPQRMPLGVWKQRPCRRHGMKIAQRFIAGDVRRRTVRVPEGRQSGTQPSLRDFLARGPLFPALKRWAIVNRPSGTRLAGIPKGALLVGNSKASARGMRRAGSGRRTPRHSPKTGTGVPDSSTATKMTSASVTFTFWSGSVRRRAQTRTRMVKEVRPTRAVSA